MITLIKRDEAYYIKMTALDTKEFNAALLYLKSKNFRYEKDLGHTTSNPKMLVEAIEELGDEFETFMSDRLLDEIANLDPYTPSFKPRRLRIEQSFFDKFPPKGLYQIEDAMRMASYGRFLNANTQGTGKTYETIQAINQMFHHGLIDRVLLVVIPVVMYNWKRELLLFSDLFTEEDILIVTGSNRDVFATGELPRIVITSYSSFRLASDHIWKIENPYKPFTKATAPFTNYCKKKRINIEHNVELLRAEKEKLGVVLDVDKQISIECEKINKKIYQEKCSNYRLAQIDFSNWGTSRLIVLDESHKAKSINARWTQILHKHKDQFDSRFCLSGTPHPQGVQDLYSNIKFLDDALVESNYIDFLHTIGDVGTAFSKYALARLDEEKANKFRERIKPYFCRRFLRDVIDGLPEVFFKEIYIQFDPREREMYQAVINEELTTLKEENGVVKYKDLIMRFPYMMAVLSDPLLLADKILEFEGLRGWKFEDSSKYQALASLVSDIHEEDKTQKIIVWEEHPDTIERLGKAFKKLNPILVHGGNTPKGEEKYSWRDGQIAKFKNDRSIKMLIANPKTLGTGVNLQFVQHVAYFSRGCDFVNWDQSISRTERIGMVGEVVYYVLIIDNSLDVHVDTVLKDKETLDRLFLKQGLSTKDCKDIFAGARI